jgi:hypothetical protein
LVIQPDAPPFVPHRQQATQAALHRIAMTQAYWHPEARAMITGARVATEPATA